MDASSSEMPPLGKRTRPEFVTPGPAGPFEKGREAWKPASSTYQNETNFRGTGARMPGDLYSSNMLRLEQQAPQLWSDEIMTWEQHVVREWKTNKRTA